MCRYTIIMLFILEAMCCVFVLLSNQTISAKMDCYIIAYENIAFF